MKSKGHESYEAKVYDVNHQLIDKYLEDTLNEAEGLAAIDKFTLRVFE